MLYLSKIAEIIEGEMIGKDVFIEGISQINKGSKGLLSFIDNPNYLKNYNTTKCSALIVSQEFNNFSRDDLSLIKVSNPRLGLLKAINHLFPNKKDSSSGVSDSANVSNESSVGDCFSIGHFSSISNNCQIGKNVSIGSNCSISNDVFIGDNVKIFNNVVVEANSIIGKDSIIESGAVIGSNGFGTVKDNKTNLNFPHIGKAIIGRDVWIGSNASIDRGSIGDTYIGDNTKIDNLVQIAHNVRIGKSCLIAAGTAIAGTTIIGDFVSIGGQVGIIGHLNIGDNCLIGAKSLVTKSFSKGLFVSGNPAKIHKQRVKEEIALRKLPDVLRKSIK